MDLNKEIKLSDLLDLVRRSQRKPRRAAPVKPVGAKRKRRRKQEIVGLKIGASQIAASRVVNNGGPAKLVQLARVPLEPGVVVGGEVRDVKALASALDRFFAEHKLPRRGIRLGIGTNRIGVRTIEIDGIDDERQLANAVRFRAHQELAIPIDEAILDYNVISETVGESDTVSRRVLVAAAYRDSVDHYVVACREAGVELQAVDVEAFALLRAVAPAGASSGDGVPIARVVVSIGHDRSTLAISDGTTCDFTRVLDWGGHNLETAIARGLGLNAAESAELKLRLSLGPDGADPTDLRLVQARAAVVGELEVLARELVASLQSYQAQRESLAISEILVTGGTTRLTGLAEELERLIRVPVRPADPLAGVELSNGVAERDDLASLAVAIGLGVGH
jgi:type IV pilus assembly protein PilM